MGNTSSLTAPLAGESTLQPELLPHEHFWVLLQPYLLKQGYKLRPRYDPKWKPSWKRRRWFRNDFTPEDKVPIRKPDVIDAMRIRDDTAVVLKVVERFGDELRIIQYLNSEPLRADPRNHTVPLLDVVALPNYGDRVIIVMPMLTGFCSLPFRYVSEVMEALDQFLEGLAFMHDNGVIHRDSCRLNLMMDTTKIIPGGFHFLWRIVELDGKTPIQWHDRRSVSPVSYYFIDFGLSMLVSKDEDYVPIYGWFGQDRTVPECFSGAPYNAYHLDVYQLGNIIRRLCQAYPALAFLIPLGEAMTHQKPTKRPGAGQASQLLRYILSKLSKDQLAERIWHRDVTAEERQMVEENGVNPMMCASDI
ncbi:hypothetical protein NLJ89_g6833 [Agrocybe chaxingu]|uniref:Protein kinase domain-containing protein n=1 Tax=Agrocybe chaxingu TaxID=84603 RepID=A0A9W8K5N9_9AGAR|nr:hypothetical protein NLJ89_g6833 [Agrocybe chaxingu]